MKKLPIGTDDFKTIIDDDLYFVDKSLLIKDIINDSSLVKLITRPRRFGKTLNQSMLYYFFTNEEDNSGLFSNLEISKCTDIMKYCGKYPVIFVSFKDINSSTFESSIDDYKCLIRDIIANYSTRINNKSLINILNGTATLTEYKRSLLYLTKDLHDYYNEKVIVLIDEYDVPITTAYHYDYYDNMIDVIRGTLSSVLKGNRFIKTSVVTGCLRIAKESIFTGLNNLNVYDISRNEYSSYFGFTEKEVLSMLNYFELSKYINEIKDWYDGYKFGKIEIYNPFSIIMCMKSFKDNDTNPIINYWINTSENSIIDDLLKNGNLDIYKDLDNLINGKSIDKQIYINTVYKDIKTDGDIVWSILYYSGYVKAIDINSDDTMKLVLVNNEIKSYLRILLKRYGLKNLSSTIKVKFVDAIMSNNANDAMTSLNYILHKTISFYDTVEAYYHGIVTGLIVENEMFTTLSNRESGTGRFDLAAYDKINRSIGVVLEFKIVKDKKFLKKAAEKALLQINKNLYTELLEYNFVKKIYTYGIAFYDKDCYIVGDDTDA